MSIVIATLDAAGWAGSATIVPLTTFVFPSKLSYVSSAWNSAVLFARGLTSYVFACAKRAGAAASAARRAMACLMAARTGGVDPRFRPGVTLFERTTDGGNR